MSIIGSKSTLYGYKYKLLMWAYIEFVIVKLHEIIADMTNTGTTFIFHYTKDFYSL